MASTSAESKPPAKKKYPVTHPSTLEMMEAALKAIGDKHGSTVQVIKIWILANYKTVRADMIKSMLKNAITKGIETGRLVRPARRGEQSVVGLQGRFLLGKPSDDSDSSTKASKPTKRKAVTKKKTPVKKAPVVKKTLRKKTTAKKTVVVKIKSPSKAQKKTKK
uniref:Histone H1 n=1 Tax=Xenoturbella bocki TaxID=242395 RepID=D2N2P0_XENBC|nr:histone H1 [Xenoturbella bocki]